MAYFKCGEGSGTTVIIDSVEVEKDLKLVTINQPYTLVLKSTNINGTYHQCKDCLCMVGDTLSKWNGSKISSVSMPVTPKSGGPLASTMHNGNLHVMRYGGWTDDGHYKYDGSSWTKIDTRLGSYCINNAIVSYKDSIHSIGGGSNTSFTWLQYHYRWNGTSWSRLTDTPFSGYNGRAIIYNDELHYMSWTSVSSSGTQKQHYTYNGSSWTQRTDVPWSAKPQLIIYKGNLHCIAGTQAHYKYDGSSWTQVGTTGANVSGLAVYNDYVHLGLPDGLNVVDLPSYFVDVYK